MQVPGAPCSTGVDLSHAEGQLARAAVEGEGAELPEEEELVRGGVRHRIEAASPTTPTVAAVEDATELRETVPISANQPYEAASECRHYK